MHKYTILTVMLYDTRCPIPVSRSVVLMLLKTVVPTGVLCNRSYNRLNTRPNEMLTHQAQAPTANWNQMGLFFFLLTFTANLFYGWQFNKLEPRSFCLLSHSIQYKSQHRSPNTNPNLNHNLKAVAVFSTNYGPRSRCCIFCIYL